MTAPAAIIRPGTLIVSMPARAHDNLFCGTADEAEAFAAKLIEAAWDARHPAPAAAGNRNDIAPRAQREAAD
ncbi:hypothetical protein G3545_14000 [Starkeya sp. ORNL1]|uniref:hypothetical protein n=1 Tax=Starkeya sp. ORNL1 TaxID=2709380 RepID=UPI0014628F04|nr:hypothetical protein [Starkeya sp. ORNL1]QJP14656.1 hypothetical protein G3545_14000 [Starkeya sp. ORNL1]